MPTALSHFCRSAQLVMLFVCGLLCVVPIEAKEKSEVIGKPVQVDRIEASEESRQAWGHQFTPKDQALLESVQQGCFNYFWNEVGQPACLVRDKTTDTVCSIAAVGYQLSSLPIGVEHGWVTHDEATERAITLLTALVNRQDNKKHGVYFHFVDADTGGKPDFSKTRRRYELMASTIDHALFQAGLMTAASYFGGEIATLADQILAEVKWAKFRDGPKKFLSMGWKASTDVGVDGPGKIWPWGWKRASDEERLIYFLATGAGDPASAIPAKDYFRLERSVESYADEKPYVVSWSGSLFMYFFSHGWIDYGAFEADDPSAFGVEAPQVDWFENTRRAALTHRRRCIDEAERYPTLGPNRWGLTPCAAYGGYCVQEFQPNLVDNDRWCDGIVAPYGAASVLPMVPAESMAALREYRSLQDENGKPLLWREPTTGGYGFADAFKLNPREAYEVYLGIDQGPMLLAIENARTGLVWELFMQHPIAQSAVKRLKLQKREKTWLNTNE